MSEPPSNLPYSAEPGLGARWGPSRALGGLAALLVLILIEATAVAVVDPEIESLGATLVLQAALAITLVAVAVVAARGESGAISAAELGLRSPVRPAVKASVLAYLAYIGAAAVIAAFLQPEQEDVTRDLGFGEGAFGSIAAGVLIIGAAPVSEEVFFRGFMFAGLRRGAPFVVAALISAAVWGLFHFDPQNPSGSWAVVLQLSVFGVALAWLYERTGSIWPPIAVHTVNNALAFAILTS